MAAVHPPGKADDFGAMLRVVRHLLVAHTRAYHAIQAASAACGAKPSVCLGLNHVWHVPNAWWNLASVVICLFLNVVYNFVLLDAVFCNGRFPNFPVPFRTVAWLCGWGDDVSNLAGTAGPCHAGQLGSEHP